MVAIRATPVSLDRNRGNESNNVPTILSGTTNEVTANQTNARQLPYLER